MGRHVGQRQPRRRRSWSCRGDGRPERDPGLLPALASRAGLSPPPAAGTGWAPFGAWAEGRLSQRGLWESTVCPPPTPPRHPVAMVTRRRRAPTLRSGGRAAEERPCFVIRSASSGAGEVGIDLPARSGTAGFCLSLSTLYFIAVFTSIHRITGKLVFRLGGEVVNPSRIVILGVHKSFAIYSRRTGRDSCRAKSY